jgi:DNA-binding phage protein
VSSELSQLAKGERSVRSVFYRLYGDIVAQLNIAVGHRIAQEGCSQASIAKDAGQDPAFLSRILSGQSGTNLRTISAVLAVTNYRLQVKAIPCEDLNRLAKERREKENTSEMITLVASGRGTWTSPKGRSNEIDRLFARSNYELLFPVEIGR